MNETISLAIISAIVAIVGLILNYKQNQLQKSQKEFVQTFTTRMNQVVEITTANKEEIVKAVAQASAKPSKKSIKK